MIVGSLLLTIGALALLLLGLVNGSDPYLVGSISASLLAAIAIVVGSRRASAGEVPPEAAPPAGDAAEDLVAAGDGPEDLVAATNVPEERIAAERAGSARGEREPMTAVIPVARIGSDEPAVRDEEPPDEPVAQQVPAGDAAQVARMSNDVLVIDGRPRYHLADCAHLLGRTSEALPVHEAVELGFTPCGLCEPDSALLADAGRA